MLARDARLSILGMHGASHENQSFVEQNKWVMQCWDTTLIIRDRCLYGVSTYRVRINKNLNMFNGDNVTLFPILFHGNSQDVGRRLARTMHNEYPTSQSGRLDDNKPSHFYKPRHLIHPEGRFPSMTANLLLDQTRSARTVSSNEDHRCTWVVYIHITQMSSLDSHECNSTNIAHDGDCHLLSVCYWDPCTSGVSVILQISSDACVFCRPLKKHMSSNIVNKFEIVVWIGRSWVKRNEESKPKRHRKHRFSTEKSPLSKPKSCGISQQGQKSWKTCTILFNRQLQHQALPFHRELYGKTQKKLYGS